MKPFSHSQQGPLLLRLSASVETSRTPGFKTCEWGEISAQTPAQTLIFKFPILLPQSRGRVSEYFQHGESEWGQHGSILGSFGKTWTLGKVGVNEDLEAVSRG